MGGLHAAIDALLDITAAGTITAADVERIDVDLSEPVFHHGWWPPARPLTPTAAQMNIGYALAVTLLDGAALAAQFSPARIDADDVWDVIPRITAHHRGEYDAQGSMGRGQTEVRVPKSNPHNRHLERTVPSAPTVQQHLPGAAGQCPTLRPSTPGARG